MVCCTFPPIYEDACSGSSFGENFINFAKIRRTLGESGRKGEWKKNIPMKASDVFNFLDDSLSSSYVSPKRHPDSIGDFDGRSFNDRTTPGTSENLAGERFSTKTWYRFHSSGSATSDSMYFLFSYNSLAYLCQEVVCQLCREERERGAKEIRSA